MGEGEAINEKIPIDDITPNTEKTYSIFLLLLTNESIGYIRLISMELDFKNLKEISKINFY